MANFWNLAEALIPAAVGLYSVNKAGKQQKASNQAAQAEVARQFDATQARTQPWVDQGKYYLRQYRGMTGTPGQPGTYGPNMMGRILEQRIGPGRDLALQDLGRKYGSYTNAQGGPGGSVLNKVGRNMFERYYYPAQRDAVNDAARGAGFGWQGNALLANAGAGASNQLQQLMGQYGDIAGSQTLGMGNIISGGLQAAINPYTDDPIRDAMVAYYSGGKA